jgi:UDP-GlcNAc3NAcA epimerase
MKIITIVGARPQFIKSAAISRAIQTHFSDKIQEIIVHTGQHYDHAMSQIFFDEMKIPKPDYNLQVGSGTHGKQTAEMIVGIEEILLSEKPQALVVYGDTNSTLAGAIAAAKYHIPIVHIEAGLRSFNKKMPEEVNRIMCDHVSTLLFSPTATGFQNLQNEGFNANNTPPFSADNPCIYHCGDIMYDNSLYFGEYIQTKPEIFEKFSVQPNEYILATIHRNNNTDDHQRLTNIFRALIEISKEIDIILPIHPRTKKMLESFSDIKAEIETNSRIKIIAPLGFLDMTALEANCKMVMTDSGGVQKEAYYFQKPCVIFRPETEWVELIENGTCIIADADSERILKAYKELISKENLQYPDIFGDGKSAIFIMGEIYRYLNN